MMMMIEMIDIIVLLESGGQAGVIEWFVEM